MLVTTCPGCDTTFKLTVAILEKAGGQVRCGRCARIFDANRSLREQPETETERLPPAVHGQAGGEAADVMEFAEAAASPGSTATRWYLREDPPAAAAADPGLDDTAARHVDTDFTQTEPGSAEPVEIEVADIAVVDAQATVAGLSAAEAGLEEVIDPPEPAQPVASLPVASLPVAAQPVAALSDPVPQAEITAAMESADWRDEDPAPVRRRTWPWAVAAGVLALTLAAQLIHAARHDLAAIPHVGPILIAAYAQLGRELTPPVALEQYSTVDLTAVAEPVSDEHGWLIIETRVQNRGPKVQPYPHILVRLLDRWQESIAGRYFAPEDYLVTPLDDYSRMSAGTTVDAQFIIVDPGPSATGFELEFCAKVSQGYRCDSN